MVIGAGQIQLYQPEEGNAVAAMVGVRDGLCSFEILKERVSRYAGKVTYTHLDGLIEDEDRDIATVVAEGGAKYGMEISNDSKKSDLIKAQVRTMYNKMTTYCKRNVSPMARDVATSMAQTAYDAILQKTQPDSSDDFNQMAQHIADRSP